MGPKLRSFVNPRLLLAGILMIIGFGALSTTALAQDGTPESDAAVSSLPETGMQAGTPESDAVSALPETGMQVGTPEADGVSALPETGSGSDDSSIGILVTASILAVAAVGLVALGARRIAGRT